MGQHLCKSKTSLYCFTTTPPIPTSFFSNVQLHPHTKALGAWCNYRRGKPFPPRQPRVSYVGRLNAGLSTWEQRGCAFRSMSLDAVPTLAGQYFCTEVHRQWTWLLKMSLPNSIRWSCHSVMAWVRLAVVAGAGFVNKKGVLHESEKRLLSSHARCFH